MKDKNMIDDDNLDQVGGGMVQDLKIMNAGDGTFKIVQEIGSAKSEESAKIFLEGYNKGRESKHRCHHGRFPGLNRRTGGMFNNDDTTPKG